MILTSRAFKMLARTGNAPENTVVCKDYAAAMQALPDRRVRFTLSRPEIDREGDIVALSGWDVTAHQNTPTVLWNHDMNRLIGRTVEIGTEDGALKATVEFIPADVPEFGPLAEGLYRLCQNGFITACSVGFRPIEWSFPDEDAARGDYGLGINFERQELLEWSLVTIPCLPSALIERPHGDLVEPLGNPPPIVSEPLRAAEPEVAKSADEVIAELEALKLASERKAAEAIAGTGAIGAERNEVVQQIVEAVNGAALTTARNAKARRRRVLDLIQLGR